MNCLIVDDQLISRVALKGLIGLDPSLTLVGECADAGAAHQKILNEQIDLLFLDIEMPGMSGMELAEILIGKGPVIIFTTSLPGYAAEAFDLNVVDFLVKPIAPARFLKAVEKAKALLNQGEQPGEDRDEGFIFIRDSNILKKLNTSDILYLEAKGDYVKFYLADQLYSVHSTLVAIEKKLSLATFFRVHRSFIVNIHKIDKIEGGTLIINGQLVPVANVYRAPLYKRLQIV